MQKRHHAATREELHAYKLLFDCSLCFCGRLILLIQPVCVVALFPWMGGLNLVPLRSLSLQLET